MGNRVHSGPVPARQGGLLSTIVRWRGGNVAFDTDLVAGMRGDTLLAPATRMGYFQFGQLGHWVSLPGGG